MLDLAFEVLDIQPAHLAASPMLNFKLGIKQGEEPVAIQSITLQAQVRIDTKKRIYKPEEREKLTDLFGEPERWSHTLRNMLWTLADVNVPAFDNDTEVDLPVPCTFDFNVSTTKYFHGLEHGKVPLQLLFSGTIFYRDEEGALTMDLISWNAETKYRMPVVIWQEMMDMYYPNLNWLCLNRKIFNALYEYKRHHGYTGFDEAITSLLPNSVKAAS